MRDILWFMGALSLVVVLVASVARLEYADGYAAGSAVAKTTDQQCVAWLFETNIKEAKKRICK